MNSSRVRQNHSTKYCLTHYYVRIVSLVPASDLHPQKLAVEFFNPHQRTSKWRRNAVDTCQMLTIEKFKTMIWIPLEYGKPARSILFDPLLCLKKFHSSLIAIYITQSGGKYFNVANWQRSGTKIWLAGYEAPVVVLPWTCRHTMYSWLGTAYFVNEKTQNKETCLKLYFIVFYPY